MHIDIQQQVIAGAFCLFQEAACRAVVFAEDLGILQKFILGLHALELFALDEIVFPPILFAPSWLARGIGNGKFQVLDSLAQLVDQR